MSKELEQSFVTPWHLMGVLPVPPPPSRPNLEPFPSLLDCTMGSHVRSTKGRFFFAFTQCRSHVYSHICSIQPCLWKVIACFPLRSNPDFGALNPRWTSVVFEYCNLKRSIKTAFSWCFPPSPYVCQMSSHAGQLEMKWKCFNEATKRKGHKLSDHLIGELVFGCNQTCVQRRFDPPPPVCPQRFENPYLQIFFYEILLRFGQNIYF